LMSVMKAFACLDRDADDKSRIGLRRVELLAPEHRNGHALEVLHRDVEPTLELAELEHLTHVVMRDARGDLRLVEEHANERFILCVRGEDALDTDELLEAADAAEAREKDLGHPTLRE